MSDVLWGVAGSHGLLVLWIGKIMLSDFHDRRNNRLVYRKQYLDELFQTALYNEKSPTGSFKAICATQAYCCLKSHFKLHTYNCWSTCEISKEHPGGTPETDALVNILKFEIVRLRKLWGLV